jgi:ketosteroid isomerase-like protein
MEDAVNRFYAQVNAGDVDGALTLLADDVRWERPPDVPISGTEEGIEAVRRMWTAFTGSLERFEIDPDRLELHGDQVLAPITMRGVGKSEGTSFEFSGAQLFTVTDGRIARVQEFRTVVEAEAAIAS